MRREIRKLSAEAAEAGDEAMVQTCLRALMGDSDAIAECRKALEEARAQEEGE